MNINASNDLFIYVKHPSKEIKQYLKKTYKLYKKLCNVRFMIIRRRNYQTIKHKNLKFTEERHQIEQKIQSVSSILTRIFDTLIQQTFIGKNPEEKYIELEFDFFDELFRDHFKNVYQEHELELCFEGNKLSDDMVLLNYKKVELKELKSKRLEEKLNKQSQKTTPQVDCQNDSLDPQKNFQHFLENFKKIPLPFTQCNVTNVDYKSRSVRLTLSNTELAQNVPRQSHIEFHMENKPDFQIISDDSSEMVFDILKYENDRVYVFQVSCRNDHGQGKQGPIFVVKTPERQSHFEKIYLGSTRPEESFCIQEFENLEEESLKELEKNAPGITKKKAFLRTLQSSKDLKFRQIQKQLPLEIADLQFKSNYVGLTRNCIVFQYGLVQQQVDDDTVEEGLTESVFYPLGNKILVNQIFCGADSSFAISMQMDLFGWGRNRFGELGTGDCRGRDQPVRIDFGSIVTETFFNVKGRITQEK